MTLIDRNGQLNGRIKAYAILFTVISGSLQGASDTRTPFVARTTGLLGFYLGFSYLASVHLGYGVPGLYAGIVLCYVWSFALVAWGFARGGWAERATRMMTARGSVSED